VLSDEPYSRLEGLFRPSLHSFTFGLFANRQSFVGLTLGGGDRLDLIRWAAQAVVEPASGRYSVAGGLLFNDLAPWQLSVGGNRLNFTEDVISAPADDREREQRNAEAALTRTWRGTYQLALGGAYAYDARYPTGSTVASSVLRLYGPFAGLGYTAFESTPYAGARRGLALALDGAYYPRPAGAMRDGRAELDLYVPVPTTNRHVVHLTVRGRALLGAPRPTLQVGGWSPLAALWASPTEQEDLEYTPDAPEDLFPAGVAFSEPLRGFEDRGFDVEHVTIAELAWSYPLIIDRGLATMLFLPAGFVNQLDLGLFGVAARFRPDPTAERVHAAGGGTLTLHVTFMRVPFYLRYQVTRRFTDDRGYLQMFGLGAGS
jgi:hypothetical protein